MRPTFSVTDVPAPSTRTLPRFLCAATIAAAVFATLAACESTPSGRPSSSKSQREQREPVKKSPAQWSMMDEETGEEVVFEFEMDDDDASGDDGQRPNRSSKRMIRREIIVEGKPLPPGMIPPGASEFGPTATAMPVMGMPAMATTASAPMPTAGSHPPPVMLGVRMREVDPVLATHLGLNPRKCSVLEDVSEELSGHGGGLRDHDIITSVDGSDDASPSHIRRVLRSKKPGDTITFGGIRGGDATFDATVTLEPFDHGKLLSVTPARVGG